MWSGRSCRAITRHLLKDGTIVRKDGPRALARRGARLDTSALDGTFKFTIVRAPFDCMMSAFLCLRDKVRGWDSSDFVVEVLGLVTRDRGADRDADDVPHARAH